MTERIGIAFAGCTHPHIFARLELLRDAAECDLIGCFDPDSGLTTALARDYGVPAFSDVASLLDQPTETRSDRWASTPMAASWPSSNACRAKS